MVARRVVIVAFPKVQSLDVTGPLEVFTTATLLLGGARDGYAPRWSPAKPPRWPRPAD